MRDSKDSKPSIICPACRQAAPFHAQWCLKVKRLEERVDLLEEILRRTKLEPLPAGFTNDLARKE